jgi:polysaccharide pyruvyl transferase WcaK-like protein
MKNILVFGYYHKSNLGDQLFIQAFRKLFPEINLTFVNKLHASTLKNVDGVFIGGGSLLNDPMDADWEAYELLKDMPVFYIGVGVENIHPTHSELMHKAKLIAIRSEKDLGKVQELNSNVIVIPDLVYVLSPDKMSAPKRPRSILVLANVETIGSNQDSQWKHSAWNYFKSEFSQFLDHLRKDLGYTVEYATMCENYRQSDRAAMSEIINQMKYRNYQQLLPALPEDFSQLSNILSSYELIFTQRFHGAVLADICDVPFVSIAHHDKLKDVNGFVVPYYECSKSRLIDSIEAAKTFNKKPINLDSFSDLKNKVIEKLG